MDASQFHANYDTFPEPLLLQTKEGGWLTNPAADNLCLSQADYIWLAKWDGSSSIWLAGRFFCVHGHRTPDGLFLLLCADTFLSTAALNLSSQLRQRLTLAFSGITGLKSHLPDDAAAKEDFSVVSRALYQIFRIVTELDRCSENELPCRKRPLELAAWLDRLGDELRYWIPPSQDVTVHVESPAVPLTTMADPHLLNYMVTHLVSNAIKAAPDEHADIFLSLKKQEEQAILTISDNGAGFSPAFLNDPLWNQPNRLLVGRGLGLGLPIAQRITALHGGTLMVSSTKDSAQVALSLPLSVPDNFLASSKPPDDDFTGGFSMVRIVLSDALPPAAFHPDFHPPE